MFRLLINTLFPSTLIFPDGSRIDYLIREDCLRYKSAPPKSDSLEIPLKYDAVKRKSLINLLVELHWKSNHALVIEKEREEIIGKIKIFMRRRPREFEIPLS
jgi:hypothetical protein